MRLCSDRLKVFIQSVLGILLDRIIRVYPVKDIIISLP